MNEDKNKYKETALDKILKYWPLIIVTVSMIFLWGNLRSSVADHEKRITVSEQRIEAINPVLLDIQKNIVELKTKVEIYFEDNGK